MYFILSVWELYVADNGENPLQSNPDKTKGEVIVARYNAKESSFMPSLVVYGICTQISPRLASQEQTIIQNLPNPMKCLGRDLMVFLHQMATRAQLPLEIWLKNYAKKDLEILGGSLYQK